MLLAMIGMVLIYPLFNRNDPLEMIALAYQPPDSKAALGSDNFGRDLFLELIYGIRTSLQVGLIAGVFATVIGLVIGLASGYIGGMIDNLLTAITNIFIVIPSFVILILISVSIDSATRLLRRLSLALPAGPGRPGPYVRRTSSARNRDHVNIAKISGYSTPRIIISEILPYIASYVVMAFVCRRHQVFCPRLPSRCWGWDRTTRFPLASS